MPDGRTENGKMLKTLIPTWPQLLGASKSLLAIAVALGAALLFADCHCACFLLFPRERKRVKAAYIAGHRSLNPLESFALVPLALVSCRHP
jgi:hypothetical protein